MNLRNLQRHWDAFGHQDPLWAILTDPARKGGKWDLEEFFQLGELEVAEVLQQAANQGIAIHRGRALDFGCGVGRLTQALGRRFEESWDVDIAPSMIRLARLHNRHAERCRYELNPAPDLRLFADHTFDFIYSSLTLQHMRPRYAKRYLKEFLRVLSPGGCLVFRLPSELRRPHSPFQRVARCLYWWYRDGMAALAKGFNLRMEMYGIARTQVLELIACRGGETVAVLEDHSSGPAWYSFLYFVRKPAAEHCESSRAQVEPQAWKGAMAAPLGQPNRRGDGVPFIQTNTLGTTSSWLP